jgi:hypothetical protein
LGYNALTGQEIIDYSVHTNEWSQYVYAPDGTLIARTSTDATGAGTAQTLYALTDQTGSVLAIVDQWGSVQERYQYDALGNA